MSIKDISEQFLMIAFSEREPVKECTACCSLCKHLQLCQMYADAYSNLLKVGEYH